MALGGEAAAEPQGLVPEDTRGQQRTTVERRAPRSDSPLPQTGYRGPDARQGQKTGQEYETSTLWLGAGESVLDVARKARMLEGACQLVVYDGERFMRVAHPELDGTLDWRSSVAYSTPPARAAGGAGGAGATAPAVRRAALQLAIGPGSTRTESEAGQEATALSGCT